MAYKGLIIINSYDYSDNNKYKVERMTDELNKLGVAVETVRNDAFICYLNKGEIVNQAKDYDFVLFFDKDKYVARMLEKSGVRVFNSSHSIEVCDDKMLTHIELSQHGINMPTTLGGALCYRQDSHIDQRYIDRVEYLLGYPMVIKQCYGSYGKQVFLADNRKELSKIVKKIKCTPYLFQQYLGKYKGSDYRAIVIGGKLLCAMKRVSDKDFRSNIELGGKGYNVDLPDNYRLIAEKTAQVLGLDYCGVDILTDDNDNPAICEVNSNAMFKGIEKTTGVNVAQAFAQHIVNEIKNKVI